MIMTAAPNYLEPFNSLRAIGLLMDNWFAKK
jgi:hypothetical protein